MKIIKNPFRGQNKRLTDAVVSVLADDPAPVLKLLEHCPKAATTPLVSAEALAKEIGISELRIKDERARMGLGSFKALGAAYAVAQDAYEAVGEDVFDPDKFPNALAGKTYITASAGNHGLSVAGGARVFGAKSVITIAQAVPEDFAIRLRDKGATVIRHGTNYAQSMDEAQRLASENGWTLLSDSTWDECETGTRIMEGYLAMCAEMATQYGDNAPTHIFLQAGVGGLAAAVAAGARRYWGDAPEIFVVEPDKAPALQASIEAGKPLYTDGPVSNMGRLDCKEPSFVALNGLGNLADHFVTLSDDAVTEEIARLKPFGLETSPSGGAGFATLSKAAADGSITLGSDARVLVILSEGPADE